jgi:phosphatidylinositol glycan class B
MRALRDPAARTPLLVLLAVTCLTAYGSYAYFHLDEYVQIVEPALRKLGLAPDTVPPWEYAARMRAWLQPALYVASSWVLTAAGVRDVFSVTFFWRLLTGVAGWAALCALFGTSLRWFEREEDRRAYARSAALLGFLPYLLVRTSQEALSAAAFTFAFAVVLDGVDPSGPMERREGARAGQTWRFFVAGVLCGMAFEFRFQTAILTAGLFAWLRWVGRAAWGRLGVFVAGVLAAVVAALPVDRWGYGEWTLPPLEYVRANVVDAVAGLFGEEPPFAYFYLSPANVFFPVVALLLVAMLVAWWRHPRHAVTWTTAPFFVIHSLIAHKEERFLFPMVLLATTFPAIATAPGYGRSLALARWVKSRGARAAAKALAVVNFAGMALLAVYPLGWDHHVPFARFVHERIGDELHAYALEDIDVRRQPFGPRVYDLEKGPPERIAAAITDSSTPREWLIADTPRMHTGEAAIDQRCTLVYSEFPFWRIAWLTDLTSRRVESYNERVRPPLHPIRWRSLYRVER